MSLPIDWRLRIPAIAAPLFIISTPDLVLAECKAGIVGAFPSLNARPLSQLDEWLGRMTEELAAYDASNPGRPAGPLALNLIVHKSNDRLESDLALCVRYRVPVVITSLGARPEVNAAVHSYGGIVLHDVINDTFARKAIEKGADGLIAVAAGAGGHAGRLSPFALVQEIRRWFAGPLALSGSIATGDALLAARAMGADLGYIGSAFIATREANASDPYKQAIVAASASDIVYSSLFTGVHGNYLRASILAAGLDPEHLPEGDVASMSFASSALTSAKAWRDIWGCGQGIGVVDKVDTVAALVDRLDAEYHAALLRVVGYQSGVGQIRGDVAEGLVERADRPRSVDAGGVPA